MSCLVSLFTQSDTFRTNILKFISRVYSQRVNRFALSSTGKDTIPNAGTTMHKITIRKFYAACSILQWINTTIFSASSDSSFTQQKKSNIFGVTTLNFIHL